MPTEPGKGHAALRRGRFSQAGSCYFLTLCTDRRQSGLLDGSITTAFWRETDAMTADATWVIRCGVLMPDHAHLLVRLGERLALGQCVQRLKSKTSPALRAAALTWERGYFDHHLRPDDSVAAVFRYIYLNPYRAGLLPPAGTWTHFRCCEEDWAWFRAQLENDVPVPEWLL